MFELYPCRREIFDTRPLPAPSNLALANDSADRPHRRPSNLLCSVCRLMRWRLTSDFGTSGGVPTFHRQILFVCIALSSICIPSIAAETHEVLWNKDFDSLHGSVNDTILYVKEDDKIKFICHSDSGKLALFWSAQRTMFDKCMGQSLFACNESLTFELQVIEFQWLPDMPSFPKDEPVYFFGRAVPCQYHGMRLVIIHADKPKPIVEPKTGPAPKKTTISDWGHPKTTALARGTPTKVEYLTLPQRPKTSANIQRNANPSTTKLPKSGTVKKSVPMLKTSRAGYASVAPLQVQYCLTVLACVHFSVLHFIHR